MLKQERAIENKVEDQLERDKFVERLSEAIVTYDSKENFVIGLEGKWGSGKTSILNILEQDLKDKLSEKIKIFKYSPWNFINRKQIISDFFEQFSYFLGDTNNDELKKMSELLERMSYILKPMKVLPIFGGALEIISSGMEGLSKVYKPGELNLEKVKQNINNILLEEKSKIIIIIDDIDRLSDNEIVEIFQLVKSAGNFNNIIYILAYDYDLVRDSLNLISKNRGQEYLEKIVQVQIEIPIVGKKYINEKFLKEVQSIFKEALNGEFYKMYDQMIKDQIVDIRKLEKILNNIRFGQEFAKTNLNISDYIFMKFLQCINSNMHRKVLDNIGRIEIALKKISENLDEQEWENRILTNIFMLEWQITGLRERKFISKKIQRNKNSIVHAENKDIYNSFF